MIQENNMFGLLGGLVEGILGGLGSIIGGIGSILNGPAEGAPSSLPNNQQSGMSGIDYQPTGNMEDMLQDVQSHPMSGISGQSLQSGRDPLAPINVAYRSGQSLRSGSDGLVPNSQSGITGSNMRTGSDTITPEFMQGIQGSNISQSNQFSLGQPMTERSPIITEHTGEALSHPQFKADVLSQTGTAVKDQFSKLLPRAKQEYLDIVKNSDDILQKFGINTPERKNQFMAQIAHESDGFKTTTEYASGKAYEGRKDLGNVQPGDGTRYKGRGFIQLTGRANYEKFGKQLGIDLVNKPELAADPRVAMELAAAYWNDRGLNALADKGDLKGITKRINGGYNGLQDRQHYYNMFSKL
jgi:predicted chitinase